MRATSRVVLQKVVRQNCLVVTPHKRAASHREDFQEQDVKGEPSAGAIGSLEELGGTGGLLPY